MHISINDTNIIEWMHTFVYRHKFVVDILVDVCKQHLVLRKNQILQSLWPETLSPKLGPTFVLQPFWFIGKPKGRKLT